MENDLSLLMELADLQLVSHEQSFDAKLNSVPVLPSVSWKL
jgi:hypothetical protein